MLIEINDEMKSGASGDWGDGLAFLGRKYEMSEEYGKELEVGDVCMVHPTKWSYQNTPYEVVIVYDELQRLCTSYRGNTRVLNSYVFHRLEYKISR